MTDIVPDGTTCAWCKRLRVVQDDGTAVWLPESIEGLVSHGMCPACQAGYTRGEEDAMRKSLKGMGGLAVVAALAIAACAPSEQDLEASCYSYCLQSLECGMVLPTADGCGFFCEDEITAFSGTTTDCQWLVTYWWDCMAGASCGEITGRTACTEDAGAMAAGCTDID